MKLTKRKTKGKGKPNKNKTRTRSRTKTRPRIKHRTNYISPATFSLLRGTSLIYNPLIRGSSKKEKRKNKH